MSTDPSSRIADRLPALLILLDVEPMHACAADVVAELAATDQWRDALERARAAIHAGAGRSAMVAALADGALRSGRADRALKTIDQMAGKLPHVFAVGAGDRALSLVRVRALLAEGKQVAARHLAEKLLVRDPGHSALAGLLTQLRERAVGVSGADPLDSTTRVRRLVEVGARGRATRVARRLRVFLPDVDEVRGLLGELDSVSREVARAPSRIDSGVFPAIRGPR